MILTILIGLGMLIVVLGYVAIADHAMLAAAWGVVLGLWLAAIRDEVAEHLGGRE